MTNCIKCKFLKPSCRDEDYWCDGENISIPREIEFKGTLNYFTTCRTFQPNRLR